MAELQLERNDDGMDQGLVMQREALYYEKLPAGYVRCRLCHHLCTLPQEAAGLCKTRVNKNGLLYTIAFSNPCAIQAVPIEKEPMYHYLPGTMTLSVAVAGCNFKCGFCQNWLITQFSPAESMNYMRSSQEIVDLARANSCPTINYTYSEPTVFFEYMLETAMMARGSGVKNICHTNGYLTEKPLRHLCKVMDAICVDLKAFDESYYKDVCAASLQPVLANLRIIREEGVHLEIVNLIISGINDGPRLIRDMCRWIKEFIGPQIPLHFSGFRPRYKLKDAQATEIEALNMACEIAKDCGLQNVFVTGASQERLSTYCPGCRNVVIGRDGGDITEINLVDNGCRFCGRELYGLWKT
jgi:pyruvate formate lyase activating enzyme